MNISVISLLFFGFGAFLISILVLLKRKDEVARMWVYLSIFTTIYAISYSYMANNDVSSESALLAARVGTMSAAFIPVTWLYFVFAFLNIKSYKIFWILWPLAILFLITGMSELFIPSVGNAKNYIHYLEPGPLFHIYSINFFAVVGYGSYLMVLSYLKEKDNDHKKEILSLFLATTAGFIGGGSQFSLVYLREKGIDLTPLLCLYPFLMAYAMIKHRVLDVEKLADAFQREKLAAVGLLSASINHEIRSPLFVIKGHAETLLEQIERGSYEKLSDEERKERVKQVLRKTIEQSERIVNIAHRLTDFSKPPSDKEISKFVILNEVVDNILSFLAHGLRIDNIKIDKEIVPQARVQVNQKHLEQILLNLVINASQAMQKKPGIVRIEASEKKGRMEIRVSDTGPGIPPDKLNDIFKPFFTTKSSGTGLGLYVTKQLIERNRGKISVESQLGQGTTFILDFRGKQ